MMRHFSPLNTPPLLYGCFGFTVLGTGLKDLHSSASALPLSPSCSFLLGSPNFQMQSSLSTSFGGRTMLYLKMVSSEPHTGGHQFPHGIKAETASQGSQRVENKHCSWAFCIASSYFCISGQTSYWDLKGQLWKTIPVERMLAWINLFTSHLTQRAQIFSGLTEMLQLKKSETQKGGMWRCDPLSPKPPCLQILPSFLMDHVHNTHAGSFWGTDTLALAGLVSSDTCQWLVLGHMGAKNITELS